MKGSDSIMVAIVVTFASRDSRLLARLSRAAAAAAAGGSGSGSGTGAGAGAGAGAGCVDPPLIGVSAHASKSSNRFIPKPSPPNADSVLSPAPHCPPAA